MKNNEEVRVKKKYLMEIHTCSCTYKELKNSRKDCFTLDEFIELRKCVYSNVGWGWDKSDINIAKILFNKALELQRKAECNSSKPELGSNDELICCLTRSIELLNNKSAEFRSISENLTQIKNKLSNN